MTPCSGLRLIGMQGIGLPAVLEKSPMEKRKWGMGDDVLSSFTISEGACPIVLN